MKFPRNARIIRGQLDAAPFAAVFFLLILFLTLTSLVYTPGVPLQLPAAGDLPGTDKRSIAIAIDPNGRLFFENQLIEQKALQQRLKLAAKASPEPLTLVLQADKAVTYEQLIQVSMMAREAGIADAWLATLPRPFDAPGPNPRP